MKSKIILLTIAIVTILFIGCSNQPATTSKTAPQKTTTTVANTAPKVSQKKVTPTVKINSKINVTEKHKLISPQKVTSIVSTPAEFENAISRNGTYNVLVTRNLSIDKNLIVDGDYGNGKEITGRKIELYGQDKDKKITDRFSLAVPILTINSPQTGIEHGTFKGNIYVSSNNFQLLDTKVEGNVYFTTQEAKSTFKMDNKSKVTGKQKLLMSLKKNSASIVSTSAQFENAISNKGTCIIVIIRNITIDKSLVVNGDYTNGKNILERKIDLYRRNKDKNMTGRLNLAVTKLTVNSPRTSIEHGTFKGNIYVSSNNFQLIDANVEGNVYFTTNEAKSTFKMDIKSKVTGKQNRI